jgi:hypothetical protein
VYVGTYLGNDYAYVPRLKSTLGSAPGAQNTAKLNKHWIITLVLKKNANFGAEYWQKSLKLVIATLTPAHKCL